MNSRYGWAAMVVALLLIGLVIPASGATQAMQLESEWTNETQVLHISIVLPASAISSLRADPRQNVVARVSDGQQEFENVGLHLKGSVGSFQPVDGKPGFTLHFGKGKDFHGVTKIHLNNSVEDPTYLNEQIGTLLFAKAGLPAPRVRHAVVQLNGRELGMFVLKEGVTPGFLGRFFSDSSGELYENDAGQLADEKGGESTGKAADLTRLAATCRIADLTERWKALGEVVDLEEFVPFMALEVLMCHRDGYCTARNNYRIYHDPARDRFVFLPHGMDQLFGIPDFPWRPAMAGMVAQAVITTPEGNRRYHERLQSLTTTTFNVPWIVREMERSATVLRQALARDQRDTFDEAVDRLKTQIQRRKTALKAQLDRPPSQPLVFKEGFGHLTEWKPFDPPSKGSMALVPGPGGKQSLHIATETSSSATWRTAVLLPPGAYRFEGKVETKEVTPLPYGKNQGARLRVRGAVDQPNNGVSGTRPWADVSTSFVVADTAQEMELICELRARKGEAWFDLGSLRLVTGQNLTNVTNLVK